MGTFAENSTNIAELTEEEYCEGFAQNACENGGLRMTSANFNAIINRLESQIPDPTDLTSINEAIAELQECCAEVEALEIRVTALENAENTTGLTMLAAGRGSSIAYDSGLIDGLTAGANPNGNAVLNWTNAGDVIVGQTLSSGAVDGAGSGHTNLTAQTTFDAHVNLGQGDVFDLPWSLWG